MGTIIRHGPWFLGWLFPLLFWGLTAYFIFCMAITGAGNESSLPFCFERKAKPIVAIRAVKKTIQGLKTQVFIGLQALISIAGHGPPQPLLKLTLNLGEVVLELF